MAQTAALRRVVVLCSAACAFPLLAAGYDPDEEFADSKAPAYDEAEAIKIAALATAAYCDEEPVTEWACGKCCVGDMEDARVAYSPSTTAFAIVGRFNGECAVGFRGSASNEQGVENAENVAQTRLEGCGHNCRVGFGFLQQYTSISDQVRAYLNEIGCAGAQLTLTGHSLGGALAMIAAIDLGGSGWVPAKFYSFGQPRVGNDVFAKAVWQKFLNKPFYRLTRKGDPVLHVPQRNPFSPEQWVHSGREIYYEGSTVDGYKVCEKRLDGDPACAYNMGPAEISAKGTACRLYWKTCSHFQYLQPTMTFFMVDLDACDSSMQVTFI